MTKQPNPRNGRPVRLTITGIYKDYPNMKAAIDYLSSEGETINYPYWSRKLFKLGIKSIELVTDNFGTVTIERV